ncbi:hypothetical protein WJ0W_004631 [Paenibacillus melissococcoides]|uniref:Uncharacterized protein n=1 Tax=Paenibacillus melissococcoides TaxID=2912268 RepID=A0ABN8U8B2_9BACL|nr:MULTISPECIES: hypothetical protein [Paenibacillus]MEB9895109.1 hypothetical protein [Bacillus cereus]CAH8247397.1 hypothetical protein WJ0W_004631 [Paenibacillus melissococcoides]CAH8705267.1 hypothetical protein WDD9_000918 [Paenibacillus melissococcoides]CAH8708489.1 hypothetical protein HTL2_002003 [Paenibacillus melissococcoides]GIO79422.1 hypothetical protein J6TS7_30320 [Paenibacillus dendritiformis]
MNKQEARKKHDEVMRKFEEIADHYWECRKARSSGEMSEQEYNEKVELILQQQEAMKKEIYETMHVAIFGDHTENLQDA